jgi:pyruvate formate lyase activating enzyme
VIERDWYQLGEWQLDATGRCTECATQIPGVRGDTGPLGQPAVAGPPGSDRLLRF